MAEYLTIAEYLFCLLLTINLKCSRYFSKYLVFLKIRNTAFLLSLPTSFYRHNFLVHVLKKGEAQDSESTEPGLPLPCRVSMGSARGVHAGQLKTDSFQGARPQDEMPPADPAPSPAFGPFQGPSPDYVRSGLGLIQFLRAPPPPHQSIRNQVGPTTLRQPHSPRDERLRPPAAQQGHRKAQCQFLSYPRKTSNALLISDQCLRTFRQVVSNHCGLHRVCCDVVAGNTGQQCFPNKESNETSVVATHLAPGRCPQEQWEPRL